MIIEASPERILGTYSLNDGCLKAYSHVHDLLELHCLDWNNQPLTIRFFGVLSIQCERQDFVLGLNFSTWATSSLEEIIGEGVGISEANNASSKKFWLVTWQGHQVTIYYDHAEVELT